MAKLDWAAIHSAFWDSSVMSCDKNAWILALWLITKVRKEASNHLGEPLPRGSIAISIIDLADYLKMSRQNVRTAIKQLKTIDFLTTKLTTRKTIFYLNNYEEYQPPFNQPSNHELTTSQPRANHELTTTTPDKPLHKEKEKEKKMGDGIKYLQEMPNEEKERLAKEFPTLDINLEIRKELNHLATKGIKPKNYKATFDNWLLNAVKYQERDNPKPAKRRVYDPHPYAGTLMPPEEKRRIDALVAMDFAKGRKEKNAQ